MVSFVMETEKETELQTKDVNGECSATPPKLFDWNNPDAIVIDDDGAYDE